MLSSKPALKYGQEGYFCNTVGRKALRKNVNRKAKRIYYIDILKSSTQLNVLILGHSGAKFLL